VEIFCLKEKNIFAVGVSDEASPKLWEGPKSNSTLFRTQPLKSRSDKMFPYMLKFWGAMGLLATPMVGVTFF